MVLGMEMQLKLCNVNVSKYRKKCRDSNDLPIGTHCLEPPTPPASTNLEIQNWDGQPIGFDVAVKYVCKNGMKFTDDFSKQFEEVFCRTGNIWDTPGVWPICTESKNVWY